MGEKLQGVERAEGEEAEEWEQGRKRELQEVERDDGRGSYLDLWRGPGQGGVDREGSDVGCHRDRLSA